MTLKQYVNLVRGKKEKTGNKRILKKPFSISKLKQNFHPLKMELCRENAYRKGLFFFNY